MVLQATAERQYIFDHAWRQVKKKFYDPKMQGVDWDFYHQQYAKFLPHINNNYDFQELLSEFLGELNASHTGGRFAPQQQNTDATASLGLLYDETYDSDGSSGWRSIHECKNKDQERKKKKKNRRR